MDEETINYNIIKEVLDSLRHNKKDLQLASLLSKRYITIRDNLIREGLPFNKSCEMAYSYLLGILFKATCDPSK